MISVATVLFRGGQIREVEASSQCREGIPSWGAMGKYQTRGGSSVSCINLGNHSHGMGMDGTDQSSGSHSVAGLRHGKIVRHEYKGRMERYAYTSPFSFSEHIAWNPVLIQCQCLPALKIEGSNGPWPGWKVHQPQIVLS